MKIAALAMMLAATTGQNTDATNATEAGDIIVTATRSGIPLWHVQGPAGTLVLVGTIDGVSRTTKWDPESLVEALRKADRVMFPETQRVTASPFSLIGWMAKYKKMGTLPTGQSLSDFASPADIRRVEALSAVGKARRDFRSRHPLHLADDLRDRAQDGIANGRTAAGYVRSAIGKYKLTLVPIAKSKAKPLAKDLFASSPRDHLPCLRDALTLAEAGPAAVQARSDAWAARRVRDVLSSPAEGVHHSCWPAGAIDTEPRELARQMEGLLREEGVVVAVLNLDTLARANGVLDALQSAGHDIRGPLWKD